MTGTLCKELKLFVANVRNKNLNGERYKLNSINQLVFALKKHLIKHSIDLDGEEFSSFKETVKTVRKKTSKEGKGTTEHKPSISKPDLITLFSPGTLFSSFHRVGLACSTESHF